MPRPRDSLKLGLFLRTTGHHLAAWRHPRAQDDAGTNVEHFKQLARQAEAAGFDTLFLADSVSVRGAARPEFDRVIFSHLTFEPITLLSVLAGATSKIGLIATASTSYSEPYNLARQFASLDLISGGRAGWNLVTTSDPEAAANFAAAGQPAHAERYRRAREFQAVVDKLWDSWEEDAIIRDRASGIFVDRGKRHDANHQGEFFTVKGPLNVPRSPQGKPVLVQAGSSQEGRELAAESAEVVFTAHQTLASAQAFYRDLKRRAAALGRDPQGLKIMPGAFIVTAATEVKAKAKFAHLQSLVHPQVGLGLLADLLGGQIDLSRYPLDGPLPSDLPLSNASQSRQRLVLDLAQEEQLSIRQLYLRLASARGHWTLVGDPVQVVDQLQAWFDEEAADGFNIMPATYPEGLNDFIDLILPELRRRGLVGPPSHAATLRERLGLEIPRHPAARPERQPARPSVS